MTEKEQNEATLVAYSGSDTDDDGVTDDLCMNACLL
jgi:hypothetical protein